MFELRELSRHTPVRGIIRHILKQAKTPLRCDELTVHVLEAWQRSFPQNPYQDACLVYKLAARFPDVTLHYDELPEGVAMIEEDGRDPISITPDLEAEELNKAVEQVRCIKFSLAEEE